MTKMDNWANGLSEGDVDEIQHIIDKFQLHSDGVPVQVDNASDNRKYLFADRYLLVRHERLYDVLGVLTDIPEGLRRERPSLMGRGTVAELSGISAEEVTDGVVRVEMGHLPHSVQEALDQVDGKLGEGVATPDHVITVAPEGSPCAASEPQEVYSDIGPYPSPHSGSDGTGVNIYIADTGLLPAADVRQHAWLADVDGDKDPCVPDSGILQPYYGHGTFAAGVARCMAPKAGVYVANIFSTAGSALESVMVARLDKALRERPEPDLVHLSVATPTRKNMHLIAFERWLERLSRTKGTVCVAAAGNYNTATRCWPGAFRGVISVGALDLDWRSRAHYSNSGRWVDVYAPGTNLINAYTTGDYRCKVAPFKNTMRKFTGLAQWSGTSFAAPMVTGLIAAQMSRTGGNAEQAAAAVLAQAQAQALPGVGPILLPW